MNTSHFRGRGSLCAFCGFTLIELLITISVLSILLGIGMPSLSHFMASQKAKSYSNNLYRSYQYARHEALKRGIRVTLCGSDDGSTCMRKWREELLIFADYNNNNKMEDNELIQTTPINVTNGHIISKLSFGNKYVRFKIDASNYGGGSFVVCQPKVPEVTKQVVFQYVGRPYVHNVLFANGQLVSSSGDILQCE